MNSIKLTPEQRSEITLTNILPSDCGVIAIQAIAGKKRKPAEALAAKFGYTPETGTTRGGVDKALKSLGYSVTPVPVERGTTAATFAVTHEYGVYLVYTPKHVMALVDGDLHNSRGFWHDPVEAIMEVSKR